MHYLKYIKQDFTVQLQGRTGLGSKVSACLFARGFHLLLSHRTQCLLLQIPVAGIILAKILHYITSCLTSCEISFYADIKGGVFIPHTTGIVIGQNVKIETGVSIYQNVTIGTKSQSDISTPVIGENVYIGANSVIIGAINIGKSAVIGANSVVTKDLPEGCTAVGAPAKIIHT